MTDRKIEGGIRAALRHAIVKRSFPKDRGVAVKASASQGDASKLVNPDTFSGRGRRPYCSRSTEFSFRRFWGWCGKPECASHPRFPSTRGALAAYNRVSQQQTP
jgi:hypothetical protein